MLNNVLILLPSNCYYCFYVPNCPYKHILVLDRYYIDEFMRSICMCEQIIAILTGHAVVARINYKTLVFSSRNKLVNYVYHTTFKLHAEKELL